MCSQCSAMRAARAANGVRLRRLQHDGLNICDGYRADDRSAFVANDFRLALAYADHQATAAINFGDAFVRNDREVVEWRFHMRAGSTVCRVEGAVISGPVRRSQPILALLRFNDTGCLVPYIGRRAARL
jgi:hypothetical protein